MSNFSFFFPPIALFFGIVFGDLFDLLVKVEAQDNWNVTYKDVGSDEYELTMEWDHNPTLSLVINSGVKNPGSTSYSAGKCDTASSLQAPTDGLPYWQPRFYPKPVPPEVTAKTGVTFASVDWQPCGHKDVTICHAESHYDFHLYYLPLETMQDLKCMNPSPTCKLTDLGNTWMDQVYTSAELNDDENAKFFRLMKGNLPVSYSSGGNSVTNLNFCVDQSSAMPESGVHYGDKADTLTEWKKPVTIIGSHDCKLTFFEPMISWKWIRGGIYGSTWPAWQSGEITYDEKNFQPLPTSWSVEVSPTCKTVSGGQNCHIKIVVNGKRCSGSNGCGDPPRECGSQRDCSSNKLVGILPTVDPPSTTVASTTKAPTTLPPTTVAPTTLASESTSSTTVNLQSVDSTGTATTQQVSTTKQASTTQQTTTTQHASEISTTQPATTTQQRTVPASDYESLGFTQSLSNRTAFAAVISASRDMSLILQQSYSALEVYMAIGRPLQFALMKYLGLSASGSTIAVSGLTYVDESSSRLLQDTESWDEDVRGNDEAGQENDGASLRRQRPEEPYRRLQIVRTIRFSYEVGLSSAAIASGISDVKVTQDLNFESDASRGAAFRGVLVQEMQRAQVASPGNTYTEFVLNGINIGQIIDGHEIVEEQTTTSLTTSNDASQLGSTSVSTTGWPAAQQNGSQNANTSSGTNGHADLISALVVCSLVMS